MIHEATGKFSSRCVLPDRSSLALLIALHRHWFCARGARNAPYRGICRQNQCFRRARAMWPVPFRRLKKVVSAASAGTNRRLLAVGLQHLVAGRRNFRAVLLQTGEDCEIALVDDAAAVALDVAVTGGLLFRRAGAPLNGPLLGEGRGCGRQQSEGQNKLAHVILHFDGRKSAWAPVTRRWQARIRWVAGAAYRSCATSTSMVNAAKLTAALHSL